MATRSRQEMLVKSRVAPALLFSLFSVSLASAQTQRYVVILVGNEAGEMTFEQPSGSEAVVAWSFNDRGRGPDVKARYELDEAGLPVAIDITGVDYMKAPVTETLHREGAELVWQSAADSGRSSERGFYSTMDGPPGEMTLLIQALLKAEDQTLALLPQGKARLEVVGETALESGATLRHAELHGLGFEPQPVWIDSNDALFAYVSGWLAIVQEGNEALVPELLEAQEQRRNARYQELAQAARTIEGGTVLIDKARIFDVESGVVRPENGVVVRNGTIDSLLKPDDPRPENNVTIDAGGKTLLPGLWDMHTHLSLSDGPLQLAAGVTTVRDLANDHDELMKILEAFESGDAPGPHVFRAGFIDGSGPFAGPTKARIEDAEGAKKWIDFYAKTGYDQIKIYSSIPIELVPSMAERAHTAGMRFSGHIPAGMWAEDAVRAGFDEIQHINMIFLNFYKDIVETRNPDRFIKVAERGADLDPESLPFKEFVALLKEHGTVVDPTVAVFMNLFVHTPGSLAPSLKTAEGRLPPQVYRANLKGGLEIPDGWETRYQRSAQQMLRVIGALHEAGIPLVAGTDGMAGFTLQSELAYYQEAGISPAEILKLATIGSARIMGVADKVGTIAPGMRADLIVVDGQPDEDITEIDAVRWVMKKGVVYNPDALYRGLSIRPYQQAW